MKHLIHETALGERVLSAGRYWPITAETVAERLEATGCTVEIVECRPYVLSSLPSERPGSWAESVCDCKIEDFE